VSGSIRLGQFLKLAGLVEDGAQARIAIQSGDVTVNGVVETRRGHHLADGDVVVVDLEVEELAELVQGESGGDAVGAGGDFDDQLITMLTKVVRPA